jgi:hypothetical protein
VPRRLADAHHARQLLSCDVHFLLVRRLHNVGTARAAEHHAEQGLTFGRPTREQGRLPHHAERGQLLGTRDEVAVTVQRPRHVGHVVAERHDRDARVAHAVQRRSQHRIDPLQQRRRHARGHREHHLIGLDRFTAVEPETPRPVHAFDGSHGRCRAHRAAQPLGSVRVSPHPSSKLSSFEGPGPLRRANIAFTRLPWSRSISVIIGNCALTDSAAVAAEMPDTAASISIPAASAPMRRVANPVDGFLHALEGPARRARTSGAASRATRAPVW